ncbi:MAG: septum formation protein Maf [Clostridia bacterium]|nr:septum formation protein Maf [Clostridia bacterium]MBR6565054.1 septum formation protein Maf [Clostridia bacterium]
MGIILASASPRRKELLSYITTEYMVIPSSVEEIVPKGMPVLKQPEYLSKIKALDIAKQHPNDTVIGADTSVILGKEILGKPKDRADAEKMLLNLSGKVHKVVTGCTVVKNGVSKSFSVVSRVKFQKLTKSEIEAYLDTDEPYDKAGSYAVQGKAGAFVEWIKGDYFNIVGLPISKLKKYI